MEGKKADAAALVAAADEVLEAHPDVVRAWLQDRPGSWGVLAGQGVLAAKRRLGRRLTDPERRAVWDLLWRRLVDLRADGF